MIGNGSRIMEVTVNIHLEDGSYWADVPELPGCFASGDTLDELFNSVREGIQLYLAGEASPVGDSDRSSLHLKSAVLTDAGSA
jgi:predicted RNase H-like HicB family nuclease